MCIVISLCSFESYVPSLGFCGIVFYPGYSTIDTKSLRFLQRNPKNNDKMTQLTLYI